MGEPSNARPSVEEHLSLASNLALRSLKGNSVHEYDDVYQEACIGLMEAADNFDPDRGATFRTYASHVINGRILDYYRRVDHLSRSYRREIRDSMDQDDPAADVPEQVRTPVSLEMLLDADAADRLNWGAEDEEFERFENRDLIQHYVLWVRNRAGTTSARNHEIVCRWLASDHFGIQRELADEYGISEGRVSQIVSAFLSHARAYRDEVVYAS